MQILFCLHPQKGTNQPKMSNITLFHIQTPNHLPKLSTLNLKCSLNPKQNNNNNFKIPARDKVLDFGKHKGKLLGTLPPSYVKWVSRNLRAGDFLQWADLADQVLRDPVYQDRVEWESAQNLLAGGGLSSGDGKSVSAELAEMSERFGWDYADKEGWERVDFAMLGSSRSGRIPRRKRDDAVEKATERGRLEKRESQNGLRPRKVALPEEEEKVNNPFPGRRAFLENVRKRFL